MFIKSHISLGCCNVKENPILKPVWLRWGSSPNTLRLLFCTLTFVARSYAKVCMLACLQWHNRWGEEERGMGAECTTRDFWPGNFCGTTRKREARKKGAEKKENRKIESGKFENGRRKSHKMSKMRWEPFFLFFFAFHFSKPLKFVLGLPKWEFFYREKVFHAGKKNQEKWLPPQKNIPLMPVHAWWWVWQNPADFNASTKNKCIPYLLQARIHTRVIQ